VSDAFEYTNPSASFRSVVNSHFEKVTVPRYGVYVVRSSGTGAVLYIGKAGTVTQKGEFKKQDIPHRLLNTRGSNSSHKWFVDLFAANGPLLIEYVLLEAKPISPTLAEAMLLRAFLSEHGRLPSKNKSLPRS
jgi:hypothetical protein